MSTKNRIQLTEEQIKSAIDKTTTMGGAAKYLKVDWRTFRVSAEIFGLYNPAADKFKQSFKLQDILDGKHPQYPTHKLSKRLVKEGIKEYKCQCCGCDGMWMDKPITLQLNHIDGDNSNHRLENLEFLCPNCHTQTVTYGNKNR